MKLKSLVILLLLAIAPGCADAFFHRSATTELLVPGNAMVGFSEITEIGNAQVQLNLLHSASLAYGGGADPSISDSDGFLIANIPGGGTVGGQLSVSGTTTLPSAGPWLFAWDAGRSCFKINFTAAAAASVISGSATITNGGGVGNLSIQGSCNSIAGSVTVTWTGTGGQIPWSWANPSVSSYALNTTGRMYMVRSTNTDWNGQSDLYAYTTLGMRWTKPFIDSLKAIRPSSIRPMHLTLSAGDKLSSNASQWVYRGSMDQFTFSNGGAFPMGARVGGGPSFGSITGSNGSYTSPASTDIGLGAWVDGEVLIGKVATAAGNMQIITPGITNDGSGFCKVSVRTVVTTGDTSTVSRVVTNIPSTTGMYVGMPVYGTDMAPGALILSVTSGTSVTLNVAPLNNTTGSALTFGGVTGIVMSQPVHIDGVAGAVELNGKLPVVTAIDAVSIPNTFTVNVAKGGGTWSSGGYVNYQTIAVTGKSGGRKVIVSPFGNGFLPNGDQTVKRYVPAYDSTLFPNPVVFTYSAFSDRVFLGNYINNTSMPPEAYAQLANAVGTDLWWNYGINAPDAYLTSLATYMRDNLASNLAFHTEYCNELFDSNAGSCRGAAINFGWGTGINTGIDYSGSNPYAIGALRSAQVGRLLDAVYTGQRSRYVNYFSLQGGSGLNDTASLTVLLGTGLSSQTAPACSGSYSTKPCRPIDWVDRVGYGSYLCVHGFANTTSDCQRATSTLDAPNLTPIADAMIAGNPATAYALMTNLALNGGAGVTTISSNTGTTFNTATPITGIIGNSTIRFRVTGGAGYSNIDYNSAYQGTGTGASTFTAVKITNGVTGSAINPGTNNGGTTTVENVYGIQSSVWTVSQIWYQKWGAALAAISPAPQRTVTVSEYEGSFSLSNPDAALAGIVTPSVPVIVTGTTHSNTIVDGVSSVAGLYVGMAVSAADISGKTIASINTGCTAPCFVLSSTGATGANVGETITVSGTTALANSNLAAAVVGWRQSNEASIAIQAKFNAFIGEESQFPTYHDSAYQATACHPSNFLYLGGEPYGLYGNVKPVTLPNNWKAYDGFTTFSNATRRVCP